MNKPKLSDWDSIRMLVLLRKSPFLSLSFQELKTELRMTDGNLSGKIRLLERDGCVEVERGFNGRKRFTLIHVTPIGQMRIHEYIVAFNYLVCNVPEPEKTLTVHSNTMQNYKYTEL